jgi:hypothetical protein
MATADPESCTIDGFCEIENISRAFFYKLESQGKGPRTYSLGAIRRISRDARHEWRAARETETRDQEAVAKRTASGRKAVGSRKDRQGGAVGAP